MEAATQPSQVWWHQSDLKEIWYYPKDVGVNSVRSAGWPFKGKTILTAHLWKCIVRIIVRACKHVLKHCKDQKPHAWQCSIKLPIYTTITGDSSRKHANTFSVSRKQTYRAVQSSLIDIRGAKQSNKAACNNWNRSVITCDEQWYWYSIQTWQTYSTTCKLQRPSYTIQGSQRSVWVIRMQRVQAFNQWQCTAIDLAWQSLMFFSIVN